MKIEFEKIKSVAALIILSAVLIFGSCNSKRNSDSVEENLIDSLQIEIKKVNAGNERISSYLSKIDTLDFTIITNQEWSRLHENYSKFIRVTWPDGHITIGIDRYIQDMQDLFAYAPNTSIKQHPVRFGSGNMTCVVALMTGTFTNPMPVGRGKFINPTGKSFAISLCRVGIWKDGLMTEEYLFWDNESYMKQMCE